VVHGVVERLRGRHPRAQLPRLLLRQAADEVLPGGLGRVVAPHRHGLQVVQPAGPPLGPSGVDGHGTGAGPGARRRRMMKPLVPSPFRRRIRFGEFALIY
jgi:hypothetical protein